MAALKASDIIVGRKYRMKNDSLGAYSIAKGDVVTAMYKSGNQVNIVCDKYGNGVTQLASTITALDNLIYTKEDIEKQVKEFEALAQTARERLTWMEETESDEYDEDEFKVWQVLSTLDEKKLSKIDKARAIAKLVKG